MIAVVVSVLLMTALSTRRTGKILGRQKASPEDSVCVSCGYFICMKDAKTTKELRSRSQAVFDVTHLYCFPAYPSNLQIAMGYYIFDHSRVNLVH